MDREEAISCIKHELLATVNRKDLTGEAIGEALDMAIEALSAEQKEEDLANDIRQGVINIIRREVFWCDELIDKIKSRPSAETPTVSEKHQLLEETPTYTSTDLISRAELLDRIKAINPIPWGDERGKAVKLVWSTEEVKRLIEKAPSADRPSGEWVYSGDIIDGDGDSVVYWECDQCGYVDDAKLNYCPNCGAKMGGNK